MITAWNKDGKKLDIKDRSTQEEDLKQFRLMLALISQQYKELITKIVIETAEFKVTVEQK
ncbi:hypothetical protein LCGC14_2737690 [marine sediment metagenome]|uniref:Uncharacterized protein n=1 Tax=marine sediment metagenome TaxID=412755 RepID=A0A0F8Z5D1_9ZZZZ|nr:hypothetical protein [bacterium]